MFDKDLFMSLCKKYNVELSKTASSPMIKNGDEIHEITDSDVSRIFAPRQTYFDYSNNKISAKVGVSMYYIQEHYAIAC